MAWQTTHPSLLLRVSDPEDQSAWREFDERYGELILRYCHRCGLQHSDAEDVRQIVLVSLVSALRSFEYQPKRGRFRSYLGRVVRNAAIRYATRPEGRRAALGMDGTTSDAADDDAPDEQWEQEWVAHHLRRAMQTIRRTTDPGRVEIFDRLLAGVPVARVAQEYGMTTDAVHKIKQRTRDQLKAIVAGQIDDEEGVHGRGA